MIRFPGLRPKPQIYLKTPQQIDQLAESGRLVAETFALLRQHIRPGVTTGELDAIAEEFIRSRGAIPIYKGYQAAGQNQKNRKPRDPFPGAICASINDVICHGIPSQHIRLRQGDIVGIDIGVLYNDWVGDSCFTFAVGNVSKKAQQLLDVTYQCLLLGIEQATVGAYLSDIGGAIEQHAQAHGFSVVREYTGHGLGRKLHEEPTIFHYRDQQRGRRIVPGMVFTIEPMINAGAADATIDSDGWTVRTKDGSLSAQFEHTIAITKDGTRILTRWD